MLHDSVLYKSIIDTDIINNPQDQDKTKTVKTQSGNCLEMR